MQTEELRKKLAKEKTIIIKVKIIPNSPKNEIIGYIGQSIKIKIKAVPEKGKANKELINFLSKTLNIPKQNIEILHGHTSAQKTIKLNVQQ